MPDKTAQQSNGLPAKLIPMIKNVPAPFWWITVAFFLCLYVLTPAPWWYLVLALVSGCGGTFIQHKPYDRLKVNSAWAFFVTFGTVGITVLAFKPRSVRPWLAETLGVDRYGSWENWHIAALFWTAVVGFYAAYRYIETAKADEGLVNRPAWVPAFQAIFVLIAILPVVWEKFPNVAFRPIVQALTLSGIFTAIDVISWWGIGGMNKDQARLSTSIQKEVARIRQTFALADLPSCAAFAVMLVWVWSHGSDDWPALSPFIYGAISFQLLAAKGIFMAIEGGVVDAPPLEERSSSANA